MGDTLQNGNCGDCRNMGDRRSCICVAMCATVTVKKGQHGTCVAVETREATHIYEQERRCGKNKNVR